ncbi:uncharacterized protein B0P05DRAFT_571698 [Gilbertella persicaria]|uniref:uncharacterized protein n=1 Tax=Gilbertella persicaria TaxID=101096 RepID=UPI00221EF156|nr:uncharacterized protein B0P05DRAFT_571698 [Gilbertella persicaria]KAI8079027.1 hypothetical protein B0P05DRAFT_571698 [Gilbertella persicaria]
MPIAFKKFIYHLKLYSRFAALNKKELKQEEPEFQALPEVKTISADFESKSCRYKLITFVNNALVVEAERRLSNQTFINTKNKDETLGSISVSISKQKCGE